MSRAALSLVTVLHHTLHRVRRTLARGWGGKRAPIPTFPHKRGRSKDDDAVVECNVFFSVVWVSTRRRIAP